MTPFFTTPVAARMPRAIGRSNDAPAFRMSAGARFTVIRSKGKAKPALRIAVRTRWRLSRTAESGRPTVMKAGRPAVTSTSTRTSAASTPTSAAESNVMGGMGTLVGPLAGAAFFFLLRELFSRFFTEYYLIPVGIIFTLMVIFVPQGLLGFLRRRLNQ